MGREEADPDRQGALHRRREAAGLSVVVRRAAEGDLVALLELEQAANLVALAHVFPPDRHPYPADDVLARWRIVLDDPECTTLVVDGAPHDLDGLVAVDRETVRHLAVRPARWGTGLARVLLDAGCALIEGPVGLWCLEPNTRARGLYEHLGWRLTGQRRASPFPPHPVELEYLRPG